jgi:hypothetical protein
MELKNLIKDNKVNFSHYRAGIMYYNIGYDGFVYTFPVPLEDIGDATLEKEDRAIMYMRYIRKAIENNTLSKIN